MHIASAPSDVETQRKLVDRLSRKAWLLPVLLGVLACVYWPGLGGGFVFDDYPNIVNNPALHVTAQSGWREWLAAAFSSPSSELQRPLAMLTFAINHALTGLDPYWMKLVNLGIHLLNTVLVFGLVRCVLQAADADRSPTADQRRQWIALWVAAAWALNPINLMAVLFVVQRMESLCHTFVFAGLWLYLIGRMRLLATGRGWLPLLGGLIGGTMLGVLTKESAVLLPVYALGLEWALLGFAGKEGIADRCLLATFALILALPALVGLGWLLPKVFNAGAYSSRSFTLDERLFTEARVVIDYLHWTVVPNLDQLSLYHDDYPISHGLLTPPSTLVALLLLGALLAAVMWLRRRRPVMALGLAWFFIAHLLTATVVPLELVYEHRNYFASLGLCLVMGDALLRLPRGDSGRRASAIVALALLALYAGLTALRAREWQDPLRFSTTEAAKHPRSPRATYDLARNLVILTNYQHDSPLLAPAHAALDRAMRVPDATALPETAAIILAARSGQPINPAWWVSIRRKLRSGPIDPQQTTALGALVDCQIHGYCRLPPQEMVKTFVIALERGPDAELLNIYGNYALNVLRDRTMAMQLWQEAARLAPNVVQYQVTLARLMIADGRPDLATAHIARIRQLGRLGQNASTAIELERLAANARGALPPP